MGDRRWVGGVRISGVRRFGGGDMMIAKTLPGLLITHAMSMQKKVFACLVNVGVSMRWYVALCNC